MIQNNSKSKKIKKQVQLFKKSLKKYKVGDKLFCQFPDDSSYESGFYLTSYIAGREREKVLYQLSAFAAEEGSQYMTSVVVEETSELSEIKMIINEMFIKRVAAEIIRCKKSIERQD